MVSSLLDSFVKHLVVIFLEVIKLASLVNWLTWSIHVHGNFLQTAHKVMRNLLQIVRLSSEGIVQTWGVIPLWAGLKNWF